MRFLFLIPLFALFLASCGPVPEYSADITPLSDSGDPTDELLAEAITAYIAQNGAPPNSTYDPVRMDLNGDGLRDGIILFKLPHNYWCGWDGCGMVVFTATRDKFIPSAAVSGVRGPVYVMHQRTNGWRDIVIRVSGTNIKDRNVLLQHDGRTYPRSPMLARTINTPLTALGADMIFR